MRIGGHEGPRHAAPATSASGAPASSPLRLALLGPFRLTCDGLPVPLPRSAQRLLALLALADHHLPRGVVAGRLWPDASERPAQSSLRSALWRLHRVDHQLVEAVDGTLRLAASVTVDTAELVAAARCLVEGRDDGDLEVDPSVLGGELLVGWHDDWVVGERERLRQLGLHGLEALAAGLLRRGQHARAIDAALAAIQRDPLRESAHRILITIHLAEGNRSEALLQYRRFATLVHEELGIEPSPALGQLLGFASVRHIGSATARAGSASAPATAAAGAPAAVDAARVPVRHRAARARGVAW